MLQIFAVLECVFLVFAMLALIVALIARDWPLIMRAIRGRPYVVPSWDHRPDCPCRKDGE